MGKEGKWRGGVDMCCMRVCVHLYERGYAPRKNFRERGMGPEQKAKEATTAVVVVVVGPQYVVWVHHDAVSGCYCRLSSAGSGVSGRSRVRQGLAGVRGWTRRFDGGSLMPKQSKICASGFACRQVTSPFLSSTPSTF
jgi:hypothetical protein